MTYARYIEARRLLGIGQSDLAKATGLTQTPISGFGSGGSMPRPRLGTRDRVAYLKAYFENTGVEFTSEVPAGVRLRKVAT